MSSDFARYSCQINLPGFDTSTQAALSKAKVLIVGAGGLGCPAAQYLAGAGIGNLAILDDDIVSAGNLHRQILFTDKDIDLPKVEAAARRLKEQNPFVSVTTIRTRITPVNAREIIRLYDVVLDCTDNFDARYTLSDASVLEGKPLVYGAAYQYQGQVSLWNAPNPDGKRGPHYRDVFPSADQSMAVDCASGGVMPTLTGIIGCMQANEAIKYLAGMPDLLSGRLLNFDTRTMESYIVSLPPVSSVIVTQMTSARTGDVPIITAKDLKPALKTGDYLLVDVRTANERDEFNIGGEHIPLDDIMADNFTLSFVRPTVFYCASGIRSLRAAEYVLGKHPKSKVYSLAGGVQSWTD